MVVKGLEVIEDIHQPILALLHLPVVLFQPRLIGMIAAQLPNITPRLKALFLIIPNDGADHPLQGDDIIIV